MKETRRQVEMRKTHKPAKLRMKMGAREIVREIIVRKVEHLKVSKMEKGTIRMEYTLKAFTAKVKANHMTRYGVTRDTMP